ncbi:hypothetical protein F1880_004485 [Penicillium rolfsii]|nr:hypothetical protein F1880_004485 [Penicillium rolfsii]
MQPVAVDQAALGSGMGRSGSIPEGFDAGHVGTTVDYYSLSGYLAIRAPLLARVQGTRQRPPVGGPA